MVDYIIGSVLLILLVILLFNFIIYIKQNKVRKFPVACAGSPRSHTPKNIQVLASSIQPEYVGEDFSYENCYIVKGNSMLLCGIKDGDLIVTAKIEENNIDSLTFPTVLVLKRSKVVCKEAEAKKDYAGYKVRRTWGQLNFNLDQIKDYVEDIVKNKAFLELKTNNPNVYIEPERMIEDLLDIRVRQYRERHPNCDDPQDPSHKIVISTTMRTLGYDNVVYFSIHPKNSVVGEVIRSFR